MFWNGDSETNQVFEWGFQKLGDCPNLEWGFQISHNTLNWRVYGTITFKVNILLDVIFMFFKECYSKKKEKRERTICYENLIRQVSLRLNRSPV